MQSISDEVKVVALTCNFTISSKHNLFRAQRVEQGLDPAVMSIVFVEDFRLSLDRKCPVTPTLMLASLSSSQQKCRTTVHIWSSSSSKTIQASACGWFSFLRCLRLAVSQPPGMTSLFGFLQWCYDILGGRKIWVCALTLFSLRFIHQFSFNSELAKVCWSGQFFCH